MKRITTGYQGLDEILDGLRIGDNVVWKVDSIDDYRSFVTPFAEQSLRDGRRIVYLRFGSHRPLLEPSPQLEIIELDPRLGFESFTTRIHAIITEHGPQTFYVFDCLSELLSAWATDLMIGNFFRVTCPYLFELDTVAYFALIRQRHSLRTIARIRETTQILLDLYNFEGDLYVHPLKVWQRRSPTMFLPHRKEGERFLPLVDSYAATRLFSTLADPGTDSAHRQLDHWHHLFLQAREVAEAPDEEAAQTMVNHLCRHLIGREERMLTLARRHFSLQDLLEIKARMIGTGFIGGKTVGMLLARQILHGDRRHPWRENLESHDSFFVGSNLYYTYLVHNGLWPLFMKQKTSEGYFVAAAELHSRMLEGTFPEKTREEFQKMLEYYGQYPVIVRSSSLLEDGFGNAFAGKYDSFFLANQGTPEDRAAAFEEAVRKIFASAMSEDALTYRLQRGLDQKDEQMALLVQRVSGSYRGRYYFPELAGVGVSHNTFVWDREMDPQAGMLRLVFGLGTRAVDRTHDDYPRIIALDAPQKRPHSGMEDTRRFSQRDVDLINVESNALETVSLSSLVAEGIEFPLDLYTVLDHETMRHIKDRGRKETEVRLLTFDRFLADPAFTSLMQRLLKTLEAAYAYPVDVEFTVNFTPDRTPKINVVQCRPLQTKGAVQRVEIPENIEGQRILFDCRGNFMGGPLSQAIRRLIWVDAEEYSRLNLSDKYEVARLIGRLNKRIGERREIPTLLFCPGRLGTTTPALGVPVTFSEISNITALAEVAFVSGQLMPELSYGSHFFQDLVEADIFYLALFPDSRECLFNRPLLDSLPNSLEAMMPASSAFKKVVKVCNIPGEGLQLMADVVSQRVVCFEG
ncbi:phosphoenolpyruvate synthase [Desulfuromonas soudanensis]|uniref:Phosphoenolpyruvate synthase n=1 Tax=Desulfuromonas soudanensis TaxID=1603606 RepID=A0A0M4DGJ6_9BACT|nr:PEP/pyruvate-binding domain-containing protein [Desulfuromonas soudanensis]ALC15757.1 phosphoenolpyruvate synthase [Desulfuromonas soudanensis]